MKIKRMRKAKLVTLGVSGIIGLGAIVGLRVVCLDDSAQIVNRFFKSHEIKADEQAERIERNAALIRQHIGEFSELYIENMKEASVDYKKNVATDGLGAVVNRYGEMHHEALEAALEDPYGVGVEESRQCKFGEDMLQKITDRAVFSKLFIDYSNPELKEGVQMSMRGWFEERVDFFKDVLKSEAVGDSYFELVSKGFSREEYAAHIDRMTDHADLFYDSIEKGNKAKDIVLLSRLIAAAVNRVRNTSAAVYDLTIWKIYGSEK